VMLEKSILKWYHKIFREFSYGMLGILC